MKRIIIVGDVHGCALELKELIEKLKYDSKHDRLIFVGDLINKGPNSQEVLTIVKNMKAEVVLGNHEWGYLNYVNRDSSDHPKWNKLIAEIGKEWAEWLNQFPYYLEEDQFIVVHGGLPPNKEPSQVDVRVLTSIRTWDGQGHDLKSKSNPPWHQFYNGDKLVIYGHWAKQGLHITEKTIGLDSGCVYGGKLSAVILPEREIVQVDAKRCYQQVD